MGRGEWPTVQCNSVELMPFYTARKQGFTAHVNAPVPLANRFLEPSSRYACCRLPGTASGRAIIGGQRGVVRA